MNRFRARALAAAVAVAAATFLAAACDPQRQLIPGQHSEGDVRQLMGVPTLVWDLPDGGREWDYVTAPHGLETKRVRIGPDGRYQGIANLLTEENFARAQPGMSLDELTRLFSKPSNVERYDLKREVVYGWRYRGTDGVKYSFNAHFDPATMRTTRYSRTDDPQERAAP